MNSLNVVTGWSGLEDAYKQKFGAGDFLRIKTPGRINIIGEHTDYNDGYVLPAAINRYVRMIIGKSHDDQCRVWSLDQRQSFEFQIVSTPQRQYPSNWIKYFQAALDCLRMNGFHPAPLNCVFSSNIPIGAGLSSSAAITCSFLYGMNCLHQWNLSLLEIARIGQMTEHLVGLNCGIMDQFAVLHGKKEMAILLDCRSLEHRYLPMKLTDYQLGLINSRIKHDLVDSAYNERRKACENVVAHIRRDHPEMFSLRDISKEILSGYRSDLPELEFQRAMYVIEENDRVLATCRALEGNNFSELGTLLWQSHEGLSGQYEVSCRELDLLVALAKLENGVLGARMMGGGFGGCTLNLLKTEKARRVMENIVTAYYRHTGIEAEFYLVDIAEGTAVG